MSNSNWRDRYALIVLVSALAAIVLVVWFSKSPNEKVTQPYAQSADYPKEHHGPAEGHWLPEFSARDTYAQWFMAALSALATAVSIWAVYILRKTLEETRRAVKSTDDAVTITREIGEKQLRAYITIPTATVGGPDKPVVTINFKNSGQTPAYDVRVWADSRYHRFPLSIDLPEPEREPRKGIAVLGPGDPYTLVVDAARGFSNGERMAIQSGEAAIYVFGEILYRDAFKEKRFYRFRMFYGGDAGVNGGGFMSAHEDGNEAN
jgi:hypothetical protein